MSVPSNPRNARILAALVGLFLLSQTGCYRFVIRSGQPGASVQPGAPAQPAHDAMHEKFHGAVLADIYLIDQPYEMNLLCPSGWSSIQRRVSAFDWVINAITPFWFYADEVTVTCAASGPGLPETLIKPAN